MFKTILRGLWTFGFIGLKIVFCVLFVELGGLLRPSVTRLSLAMSHLMETLVASPLSMPKSCPQVPSILPPPSTFSLFAFGYTAILRITRNFLIHNEFVAEPYKLVDSANNLSVMRVRMCMAKGNEGRHKRQVNRYNKSERFYCRNYKRVCKCPWRLYVVFS